MYESIKIVERLRKEKMQIVCEVYAIKNIDEVYKRQTALNSMAIKIYTDIATEMMPALKKDGVSSIIWTKISGQLDKLDFIGVPSVSELCQKDSGLASNSSFPIWLKALISKLIKNIFTQNNPVSLSKKNMTDGSEAYAEIIERIKTENSKELNRWFDNLKSITEKEIAKAKQ